MFLGVFLPLLATFFGLLLFYNFYFKRRNLPPGEFLFSKIFEIVKIDVRIRNFSQYSDILFSKSNHIFWMSLASPLKNNCFFWSGPTPLPLIGNLYSIQSEMPEDCFLKWREQFGSVFTFWLGETPVVCVAEYGKIMEIFQKDGENYAARFAHKELEKILKGPGNIQ